MADIDPRRLARVLRAIMVIQAEVIDMIAPAHSDEQKYLLAKFQALANQAKGEDKRQVYKDMIALIKPPPKRPPARPRPVLKRVK